MIYQEQQQPEHKRPTFCQHKTITKIFIFVPKHNTNKKLKQYETFDRIRKSRYMLLYIWGL